MMAVFYAILLGLKRGAISFNVILKLIIVYLFITFPVSLYAQETVLEQNYKTGLSINFGVGNSLIEIEDNFFNGNSNSVFLEGKFSFKNGIALLPSFGFVKIRTQTFDNNTSSFQEISILKSPIKLGYNFNLNKGKANPIQLLPKVGFYYSNYIKQKSKNNLGILESKNNLGGNFGFVADIGVSMRVCSSLYFDLNLSSSYDLDNVNSLGNLNLRVKDDKTIVMSMGYLF